MYISEMNIKKESGLVRAEAQVTWEESERLPLTLFFETDAQYEDALWADPDGFLVSSILPAWHYGEKRLKIEGSVCPVLCSNISSATTTLRSWYTEMGQPPTIEPSQGFKAISPFRYQSASFLSCGIDSLATLRWNKLNLPSDNPYSISALVPIDFIEAPFMSEQEARNLNRMNAALRIADETGTQVIPIKTNILKLDGDGYFFNYKWHAVTLISCGYFISRWFNKVYVASSVEAPYFGHWGSNPLLDTLYNSAHLQVDHHGIFMNRYQKTALVADWPVGLQNILVCQGQEAGKNNCGACEKCIRTMTALEALGKLKGSGSFPIDKVAPELLNTLHEYGMGFNTGYFNGLIPLLKERGRDDLVTTIQQFPSNQPQPQKSEVDLTEQDIRESIPQGKRVIIATERQWGGSGIAGFSGYSWGTPSDDRIAINELETLRQSGLSFLIIREPVLWWIDYFVGLKQYLDEKYKCILQNDRVIIFDLTNTAKIGLERC